MALQEYSDAQTKALALLPELTPEEVERREKEAEKLDEKLRYIVEKIPDRVYNVMGSNAGAGSSEFHIYRHSRRREQERLARMEEEFNEAEKEQQRLERMSRLAEEDELRTAKRRAKRQRKKAKSKSKLGLNSKEGRKNGHESDSSEEDTPQPGTDEVAAQVHVPSLDLD